MVSINIVFFSRRRRSHSQTKQLVGTIISTHSRGACFHSQYSKWIAASTEFFLLICCGLIWIFAASTILYSGWCIYTELSRSCSWNVSGANWSPAKENWATKWSRTWFRTMQNDFLNRNRETRASRYEHKKDGPLTLNMHKVDGWI